MQSRHGFAMDTFRHFPRCQVPSNIGTNRHVSLSLTRYLCYRCILKRRSGWRRDAFAPQRDSSIGFNRPACHALRLNRRCIALDLAHVVPCQPNTPYLAVQTARAIGGRGHRSLFASLSWGGFVLTVCIVPDNGNIVNNKTETIWLQFGNSFLANANFAFCVYNVYARYRESTTRNM